MPTPNVWIGGAASTAQVWTLLPSGTIEATDNFTTILTACDGVTTQSVNAVAGGTTVALTCDAIVAAINAVGYLSATKDPAYSLWHDVVATDMTTHVALSVHKPGTPIYVTVTTTETGGGAKDAQDYTATVSVANSGPNDFNCASNWSTLAVPATADEPITFSGQAVSECIYGMNQSGKTFPLLIVEAGYMNKNFRIGTPQYPLKLAAATVVRIGQPSPDGSGNVGTAGGINLNFTTGQSAVTVYGSGTSGTGNLPNVLLSGSHASNALAVSGGTVGWGLMGETGVVSTLNASGGRVTTGPSTTVTTATNNGATLNLDKAPTTLRHNKGTTTLEGTVKPTTVYAYAGTVWANQRPGGTDIFGTLYLDGATVRFDGNPVTGTLAGSTVYYTKGRLVAANSVQITPPTGFTWSTAGEISQGEESEL